MIGISEIFASIGSVLKPATDLVDNLTTSKEEKLQLKNAMEQIQNALSEKLLSYEAKLATLKASVIETETKGNMLQRSWRPILMLSFGFIIIYEYFISKVFSLPSANLPSDFWELLKIGVGGYVVGRSAEKIVTKVNFNKNKS